MDISMPLEYFSITAERNQVHERIPTVNEMKIDWKVFHMSFQTISSTIGGLFDKPVITLNRSWFPLEWIFCMNLPLHSIQLGFVRLDAIFN